MKFLPLIWAGLWRKPLRTLFTVGALVAAFTVLGLVKGVDRQLDNMFELGKMNKLWVEARFGGSMPASHKQQIAELPGVKLVIAQAFIRGLIGGEQNRPFFAGDSEDPIFEFFPHFKPPPADLEALRNTRNGVAMSKPGIELAKLTVGQDFTVRVGTRDVMFHLVAAIDRPDLPLSSFSLGNYAYITENRLGGKGSFDQFNVIIEDPNKGFETARAIDAMFANSSVPTRTQLDYVRMASRAASLGDVKFFVNAVSGVTLLALILLTTNTLLQAFRERTPEFAVLKTLGFQNGSLLWLIFAEALAQFLVSAALGLALARFATRFVRKLPIGPIAAIFDVPWSAYAVGLAAAVLLALLTASLPAWRLSRLEVVEALRSAV